MDLNRLFGAGDTYNSLISSGSFGGRVACPYSDSLASSVSTHRIRREILIKPIVSNDLRCFLLTFAIVHIEITSK